MTNEEIEKSAKEIANELVRYCDRTPDDETFVAERLRSLVSQAYEEAARAVCEDCAAGNKSERGALLNDYPYKHSHDGATFPCAAARVRTLKDSLVAEPVSSAT